ncbi:uncharacterized protein LOC111085131 [Limulus polyphemus]|uniref:Uncharacterized protein LOC111085131 n=1 Tax=Limulus polyphemus TaxID=6850 RepID=A0ABM1S3D0_LIMPO|nr:uncharacterized protein LOC111085131 [Limulus polyphemus]
MAITRKRPMNKYHSPNSVVTASRKENFRCKDCQKSFLYRSNLLCHRKLHVIRRINSGHQLSDSFRHKKNSDSDNQEITSSNFTKRTVWRSFSYSNPDTQKTTNSILFNNALNEERTRLFHSNEPKMLSFHLNEIGKCFERDKVLNDLKPQEPNNDTGVVSSFSYTSANAKCLQVTELFRNPTVQHQKTPGASKYDVFSLSDIRSFTNSKLQKPTFKTGTTSMANYDSSSLYSGDIDRSKSGTFSKTPESQVKPRCSKTSYIQTPSFPRISEDIVTFGNKKTLCESVIQELEETGYKTVFHRTLRSNWSKLVTNKISTLVFSKTLKGHQCSLSCLHRQS